MGNLLLMKRSWSRLIVLILFLVSNCAVLQAAENILNEPLLQVTPRNIDISSFYNGSDITVQFKTPIDNDFIIMLSGDRETLKLSKKGRVYLLWMTVGEIIFENTPRVYMVYSTKALNQIASEDELVNNRLGYEVLKNEVNIIGAEGERDEIFSEFIKLKEKERLYRVHHEEFQPSKEEEGFKYYSIKLPIPPGMSSGTYSLDLFTALEGNLVKVDETDLTIAEKGMVAYITDLAFNQAKLYGAISVVFAIVIGVLIGLLFAFIKRK